MTSLGLVIVVPLEETGTKDLKGLIAQACLQACENQWLQGSSCNSKSQLDVQEPQRLNDLTVLVQDQEALKEQISLNNQSIALLLHQHQRDPLIVLVQDQ